MPKKKEDKVVEEAMIVDEAPEVLPEIEPNVILPVEVVEALLVAAATSNRTAMADICNQVRAIAEEQVPGRF